VVWTYYADYNAPDWGSTRSNVPLSDFFGLYPTPRPFVPIPTTHSAGFFRTYYSTNVPYQPTGPDGTSGEED